MHFYAWKKGLKTGMYYLRTKAAADAIKFTVQKQQAQSEALKPDPTPIKPQKEQVDSLCTLDDIEGCITCGS